MRTTRRRKQFIYSQTVTSIILVCMIETGRRCLRCNGDDILVDLAAGDRVCRACGEVVSDRIIDERDETINHMDDYFIKSSRTSGFSDSVVNLHTSFINGTEEVLSSLKKAQYLSTDKKDIFFMSSVGVVNEFCSRLNLFPSIKVSAGVFVAEPIE
jgi:hypothetical protein